MIKTKQIFFFTIIIISLISSCVSRHTNFSYYKDTPITKNSHLVNLNGIYFIEKSAKGYPGGYIFLYRDGTVYWPNYNANKMDTLFWSNPEEYFKQLKNHCIKFPDKEWWGHYKIRHDSIFIQYFYWFDQSTVIRDIIELYGAIDNNSTISILEGKCSWCHSMSPTWYDISGVKYYTPPVQYRFYPTSFKPDSSLAWFKKKKWYKEEIWQMKKK